MRWIFISLLVVNFIAAIWMVMSPKPVEVAEPTAALVEDSLPELKLLAEVERDSLVVLAAQKDLLQLGADRGEALCTLVGPFSKRVTAENAVENLQALEIEVSLQDVEVPGGAGYWVYLEPEESRKMALRRLRELQAKGIDSYVIPKGELANGISFGMFSRKDLADKRLDVMVQSGYEARIFEIKRSHSEVWVMLAAGEVGKVAEEFWLRLAEIEPSLEKRQNYCLGVASDDKFL